MTALRRNIMLKSSNYQTSLPSENRALQLYWRH